MKFEWQLLCTSWAARFKALLRCNRSTQGKYIDHEGGKPIIYLRACAWQHNDTYAYYMLALNPIFLLVKFVHNDAALSLIVDLISVWALKRILYNNPQRGG